MADNIIESYLVRLGVSIDKPGFDQFQGALKGADGIVSKYTTSWLENILKFQMVTTSAFASLGTAVVGLADHVASADQDYRLFGLHMYMSQSAARSTKIAMDALGESLDDIVWDPELHQRYTALIEMQSRLQGAMGPGFEHNMRSIRDLRFEFTKLKVQATQYLIPEAVSSLFDKLGLGSGDLETHLDNLSQWFAANIPSMSSSVADLLVPGWDDFKVIVKDLGREFKTAGGDFTYLTGALSGDKSLQTTEFNAKKVGEAFNWWVDVLAKLVLHIGLVEKAMLHLAAPIEAGASSLLHLGKAFYDILPDSDKGKLVGDWSAAKGEFAKATAVDERANSEGRAFFRDWKDLFLKPLGSKSWQDNPDYDGLVDYYKAKSAEKANVHPAPPDNGESLPEPRLQALVASAATKYTLDPNLLRSIMQVESHGDPNIVSAAGAQGLMQLMPQTAQQYGAKNPFDPSQNVDAAAKYLSYLLKRYHGYRDLALAAYNEGEGNLDKGYYGRDVQDYVNKVNGRYMAYSGQAQADNSVTVGDIHVHVTQPNASAQEIAAATMEAIRRKSDMSAQRNAATYSGPYATNR